jgi:hypothetical protein
VANLGQIRGESVANLGQIRGESVANLGQIRGESVANLGQIRGVRDERFCKFSLQITVRSMRALLKCDVAAFALDAILHAHLTVDFSVIFDLNFCPGCDPGFACISVFPVFGVLARTRFWSILDLVLDRISGVFETRLSIQPYKNSYPDTLPIQNKNPYPVLFRFCEN